MNDHINALRLEISITEQRLDRLRAQLRRLLLSHDASEHRPGGGIIL